MVVCERHVVVAEMMNWLRWCTSARATSPVTTCPNWSGTLASSSRDLQRSSVPASITTSPAPRRYVVLRCDFHIGERFRVPFHSQNCYRIHSRCGLQDSFHSRPVLFFYCNGFQVPIRSEIALECQLIGTITSKCSSIPQYVIIFTWCNYMMCRFCPTITSDFIFSFLLHQLFPKTLSPTTCFYPCNLLEICKFWTAWQKASFHFICPYSTGESNCSDKLDILYML